MVKISSASKLNLKDRWLGRSDTVYRQVFTLLLQ